MLRNGLVLYFRHPAITAISHGHQETKGSSRNHQSRNHHATNTLTFINANETRYWAAPTIQTTIQQPSQQPTQSPRNNTVAPPLLILTNEAALQRAITHLTTVDPVLRPLVHQHGMPRSLCAKQQDRSCFHALSETIVYQQLSIKAARPIWGRVLTACNVTTPNDVAAASATMPVDDEDDPNANTLTPLSVPSLTPAAVLGTDFEHLRAAGLSNNKARFLIDLAHHFNDGRLSDEVLTTATSAEELSEMLLQVKGVGPWSVTMFRMFHLGHADVLPLGDLGVRKGLAHLYNLKDPTDVKTMEEITAAWQPYRSVGSWYMWRLNTPPIRKRKK